MGEICPSASEPASSSEKQDSFAYRCQKCGKRVKDGFNRCPEHPLTEEESTNERIAWQKLFGPESDH